MTGRKTKRSMSKEPPQIVKLLTEIFSEELKDVVTGKNDCKIRDKSIPIALTAFIKQPGARRKYQYTK